jgi:hypothetical protein
MAAAAAVSRSPLRPLSAGNRNRFTAVPFDSAQNACDTASALSTSTVTPAAAAAGVSASPVMPCKTLILPRITAPLTSRNRIWPCRPPTIDATATLYICDATTPPVASNDVHDGPNVVGEHVEQFATLDEPTGPKRLSKHAIHAPMLVADACTLNVPLGQATHADAPKR